MYSYSEIETIWKNCNTGEEWDYCLALFSELLDDPEFLKKTNPDGQKNFQKQSLKQLNKLIAIGKA